MEPGKNFEDLLEILQCPFTWNMDDIDKTISTDYKPHDEEEFIPLLKLLRIVMLVYVQSKENENADSIINNLEKCDEIMIAVSEGLNPQFSTKAVYHVVQATQCHALWNLGEKMRANDIFAKIEVFQPTQKIEQSTINACRSVCWSKYHLLGSEEAVEYIRKALTDNPDCALWYFILGKNLRRIRRDSSVGTLPSTEEVNAFLTAHQKSKNVLFDIFVAQMYREQRKNKLAFEIYKEIFMSEPKSNTILLRLALGFMQLLKLPLSKSCLDKVALTDPDNCMYLHYRGRYWVKKKKFEEALQYFKKAADMGNVIAAKEYLRCVVKFNPSFNVIDYLINIIDASKNLPEKHIQGLLLDTAYQYWKSRDIKNALKYYLHAIEIDSESQTLIQHYPVFQSGGGENIYYLLAKQIFPEVKRNLKSLDENTLEIFDDLEKYYDRYMEKEIQSTQKDFSKMRNKH